MPFNDFNETTWQHLCTTWSGLTRIGFRYHNGKIKGTGKGLQTSFPGSGAANLGNHASQVVLLAEFNLKDRVLTQEEIVSFGESCGKASGNAKAWPDFFQYVNDKADRYKNPSSCELNTREEI